MGRLRRGGYIFEWWIGDHPPRHVHVSDRNGNLLGRVALEPVRALDDWQPSQKVLEIIRQLIDEGQL
jgi:hypothetical protein